MIGQTVSHYRILEKLGEGGMGVVYKAHDLDLDRFVALKFLPAHVSAGGDTQARFFQEVKAAAALNHPNICTIYGVERHEGQMFIAMEYLDGGTLRDRIPYSKPEDAINAAIQIGEALQEAHAKGIVHRDIKADNIMVTSKGQVKVMDFGLAKLKGSLKLTRSSSTVGTLAYMAPEQIQGGEIDSRSDLFAVGVLLFEMLSGKTPFRGEHEAAMMYSILNEDPTNIRTYIPDVSTACERIIDKALEKNPEERYQSAADLVADLKRWKRETSGVRRPVAPPAPVATEGIPTPAAPRAAKLILSSKLFLWGGIGGAVAILAVLWLLIRPGGGGTADRKTLVVLPFENQSDSSREYFSDGITEEITTRLSGLSGLGVIARSSARTYKGSKKTVKEIGNELGVQYVLLGTVRWSGQQVRVSPELVNVSSGLQVWSQALDASSSDAFSLQSDIARKVASALDVKLLQPEVASLGQNLTTNPQAYDLYLKGIEYSLRSIAQSDNEIAQDLFQKAIAADPSFSAAYAQLSVVHSNFYWFFYDRSQERLHKARSAAEKALSLNPSLSTAHEAMGWFYYHGLLDYDNSLKEFRIALDLQPGNSNVYYGMGSVYRRQGRMTESIEAFRKAVEGNPRAADIVRQLGETMTIARQYQEADEVYDRAMNLAPDIQTPYYEKAANLILWKGDIAGATAVLKRGQELGTIAEDRMLSSMSYTIAIMSGDLVGAEAAINAHHNGVNDQFHYYPQSLMRARFCTLTGSSLKARVYYDSARIQLEHELKSRPEDERVHSALGIAYAGLGRVQDAVREGERGVALLPVEKEAWRGAYRLLDLARIYVMVGEQSRAVDLLERLISIPSELSATYIRLDPEWKSLHGNARFERLVNEK